MIYVEVNKNKAKAKTMLVIVAFRFMKTSDGGTISFTYKSLITGHKKKSPRGIL